MIAFVGSSHAPVTLAAAAAAKGFPLTSDLSQATLVFVSEDTPTNRDGERDLFKIRNLALHTFENTKAPVVLTSQVPPGFTRSLGIPIYCMAETLRIKDALERALDPEQFIIGAFDPDEPLPPPLVSYMAAHKGAAVHVMYWEDAEFAKIAINMTLAAQVDNTNRLAKAAAKAGANWGHVMNALASDKRIGPHSYLTPGRWQDSTHLYRDFVTLERILAR